MKRFVSGAVLVLASAGALLVAACPDSRTPVRPSNPVGETPGGPATPPPAGTGPTAPPAARAPDVVFVGAGDIAMCTPASEETARLLDGIPGTVFTLGDHAYQTGTEQLFHDCYHPTWGRHRARTRASPGNHDYETPGAAGYFAYFGPNAGPPGLGYYVYRLGDWQIYSLNSNIPTDEASPQYQWLRGELAVNTSPCSLAYWHHPVVNEGSNGDSRFMRAMWRLLYEAGVDVVLAAHDHNYQRFAPLDGDLRRNPVRGMRQFIAGTGGARLYQLPGGGPLTEARGVAWGVLRMTLRSDGYEWEFVPVAGETFRDAGRDGCH